MFRNFTFFHKYFKSTPFFDVKKLQKLRVIDTLQAVQILISKKSPF